MRKLTLILTLTLLLIALTAGLALAADNAPTLIDVNGQSIFDNVTEPGVPRLYNNAVPGVSYDPASQTLTLDGAEITTGQYGSDAGIFANGHLTIELKGRNSITVRGANPAYPRNGIDIYDSTLVGQDEYEHDPADLHISGSGSLTINADGDGIYVHEGDLTIDGVELDITADRDGIYTYGDITIDNSQLTITAGREGIMVKNAISITDSDLTITAGSDGIYADYGDITIDNSDLTITAYYDGIYTFGDITVANSKLTITAGLDEEGGDNGVYAFGDIAITDSYVIATGGEGDRGIRSSEIIDIKNSYVYAEGGEAGIISWYTDDIGIVHEGVIVIQGGQVVEIYYEGYLTGYIFSATQQRITEESLGDNHYAYPGAAQIVEMVPLAEVMELVVPILGGVGKNFPFVDVGLNHWAYNDIFDAFKKGLINGKSETLYLPDGPLTYAEAIKLAACIHQLNSMGAVSFEASQPWYQTYVSYAELNQIIEKGEFAGQMNDAIIRYDFAHIFGKALPISAFTPLNSIDSIPDVPSSNRHADEILMLYRAGILVGSDAAGNFYGNSNIKRSEVAAIVIRMIDPARRIVK